ncbi:MAG TPA: VWA domain-containing protein [Pirellulales bacterium]
MPALSNDERLKRWRLVLGKEAEESGGAAEGGLGLPCGLEGDEAQMDKVLEALYDSDRKAGLGSSCPNVNRWLGDIRTYFPKSVVQVMQQDALRRLNLQQMLLEPETLETVEADIHLVGTLLSLNHVIPKKTRETARRVVRKVADDLERRLRNPLTQAVRGALNKASRTSRPRAGEIDWHRTIRKNLHNYQADRGTIIAERLVGYSRKQSSLRDIVLCIDQSGSMAASIVYSSIFGAVLASLRAVTTRLVVFDTAVVDLTEQLHDPVDVLFGTQLGGGTDINRAVTYCRRHITRPAKTIFILISDLYEGGVAEGLLRQTAEMVSSGVTMICLLALSDDGTPCYDEGLAAKMTALGAPSFACTPDLFPELMAVAIQKRDIAAWAARNEIVTR